MTEEHDSAERDIAVQIPAGLRDHLLCDAHGDCLPLIHVHSVVKQEAGGSLPTRQEVLLRTVRSLIGDGLMVVGRIGGEDVECVEPWDLSLDDAMARIHQRYVVQHDDRDWVFGIWFALTERGEQAAQALEARKSE
jgi:hypothetical protein